MAPPRISNQDWSLASALAKDSIQSSSMARDWLLGLLVSGNQFGVMDEPIRSFIPGQGIELYNLPHTEEDLKFAFKDLEEGCQTVIYQAHVDRAIACGAILSSSFTVWQDSGEEKKGRYVVYLSKQSKS